MLRLIRFILTDIFLFFLVLYCSLSSELVLYGLAQGKGQMEVVLHARPLNEVMLDPAFPDSLKQKLHLIQEIKTFAYDSLGLSRSDNYSTVYDQHNRPALWTITACEPFRLKAKEWYFPFLGSVSYKGFFDYKKGEKEADALRAAGFDVEYAGVGGWSTLGWFKDPILTGMLRRNAGQLADLIIHELTHGTLYVKNQVDFNENLASFIGDKGAERFLLCKYGKSSSAFTEYARSKSDRKIYNAYILKRAQGLDSLYHTLGSGESVMSKEMKKMAYIYDCIGGVKQLGLYHHSGYVSYTEDALRVKNAFFMSFRRYDSRYEIFEREFKQEYGSDIRRYIQGLVKRMNGAR